MAFAHPSQARLPLGEPTSRPGISRRRALRGTGYLYRVVVRDAAGRQYSRNFTREADARAFQNSAGLHKPTDLRAGRQTLQQLYDEWHVKKKYAEATDKLHKTAWPKLTDLHDKPIGKIDRPMIDKVLGQIDKPVMREKTRILLSTLLGYAATEGRLDVNLATKPRETLTRKERLERDTARTGKPKRYLNDRELARLSGPARRTP